MLTVHHLTKAFEVQNLFEEVSFSLNPGERVGLVGLNGCGKTTLLRILAGLENPTSGYVSREADLRIGYLPQGFEPEGQATLAETIARAMDQAEALEEALASAAIFLAQNPHDRALQQKYDDLLRRMAFAEAGRAPAILAGLGLGEIPEERLVGQLSGGQKTRLSLALVLLGDPDLLLLDEPTNHLDIGMLEWLEGWLSQFRGGVLVVSHDRTFLDHTTRRILEMDMATRRVKEYAGNYSAYVDQKQAELENQWSAYKDQQAEIRRMQQDIARVKAQAAFTEWQASSIRIGGGDFKIKGYKSYQQGIAKKVAKKAKSRQKKLERYIESDERVEKPRGIWQMHLEFDAPEHISRMAITMEDLSVGYCAEAPLLEQVNLSVQAGQRIAITGPNGSGKTTLLRTILGEIPALAGVVRTGSRIQMGYMAQDQSILDAERTALETVVDYFPTQTEARSFLAYYLFVQDEPLKPVKMLSYGQRTRLMLALLVAKGCNCLLLDEPVNHLDIPSRSQFEQALRSFEGAVLAVVHDRYFIERFATQVWWMEGGKIRVEGG
ncbi:MAG: ABC-F family ATP-binding cassette domain-containing protein [Anaerolineales bacterium]|nr:ABC-F family ATP-binding cassette domain-containing protein [Anaerolineales bacterium]